MVVFLVSSFKKLTRLIKKTSTITTHLMYNLTGTKFAYKYFKDDTTIVVDHHYLAVRTTWNEHNIKLQGLSRM